MITIRKITEEPWTLMRHVGDEEEVIGVIDNLLSFMDVRVQIGEAKAEGYFLRRADDYVLAIAPNGGFYCHVTDGEWPFGAFDDLLNKCVDLKFNFDLYGKPIVREPMPWEKK